QAVHAHADVQQQVLGDAPVVLDVPGAGLGIEHAAVAALAAHGPGAHPGRHGGAVAQHRARRVGVDGVALRRRTRIEGRAVGGHGLGVHAEPQQVVAQAPLEVQAGHLAFVVVVDHRGRGAGVAAHRRAAHRRVHRVVAGVDDHLGAFQVRGRGDHALAAVGAPHRLGHQVVAEAAGVGDRTALAAALGGAHAADVAALAAVPVVGVAGGVGLGLVGEGQQFQQVVLVDVPVQLGAPEPVVGVAVVPAGAGVEGVARIDLLLLVHGEQEQAVVDQRAGGPDVALDQAAAVAAGAVVHRHRVAGAVHV